MTTKKLPTLREIESTFEEEVSRAESKYGPQVTGRLTKPGRPPKGATIEPTRPHSIRVQESIWEAVSRKAILAGLTVNQAAQLALLEWAKR